MSQPGSAGRLLEVGRIGRPHGLRGEVVVRLTTDRHERLDPGAVVVTAAGDRVGTCVAVVANPASDLLELESGALVPVVFVTGRDAGPDGGRVTIDPPEGLFDL